MRARSHQRHIGDRNMARPQYERDADHREGNQCKGNPGFAEEVAQGTEIFELWMRLVRQGHFSFRRPQRLDRSKLTAP